MNCPTCKIPISPVSYAGQTIDRCKKCHGTWFESGEMGPVLTELANQSSIPEKDTKKACTHDAPVAPPTDPEKVCPHCDVQMSVMNYAYNSNIFLDRCATCKGVWVDEKNLEPLVRHVQGSTADRELASLVTNAHTGRHKKSKFFRTITSRRLSGGFAAISLFASIFISLESYEASSPIDSPSLEVARRVFWTAFSLGLIWGAKSLSNNTSGINLSIPMRRLGTQRINEGSSVTAVALLGWIFLSAPIIGLLLHIVSPLDS